MKKFAKVMTALSLSAACVAGTAFTALAEEFDNTNAISVQSREDGSGTRGAFIELFGIEQEDEEGNKVDMTHCRGCHHQQHFRYDDGCSK